MVVQLAYAPLPVASAVGALSLASGAGGRPCEHAVQVPAVFVHEPGGASGHQQNGGHPAAYRSWYAQCTLCSRPWTFTGTVLGMVVMRLFVVQRTGALVGALRKLWSSAVAVLVAAVQFLDKVVVPVGATTVGRALAWFDYGYMFFIILGGLWKNLYDFLREGVDSGS